MRTHLPITFRPSANSSHAALISRVMADAVFARDGFTCRCCGFRSLKYQQVLLLGNDPFDHEALATTCVFCHQCFDLEGVTRMRSGYLVWLPEIDQSSLHHAARDLYLARINDSSGRVTRILNRLLSDQGSRREEARLRIGTDDPGTLARRLVDGILEVPDGIRLMPLDRRVLREADLEFNQFHQILAYWRGFSPGSHPWLDTLEELLFTRAEREQPAEVNATAPMTNAALTARALRDAAVLFQLLGDENPSVAQTLGESAIVYGQFAWILETAPTQRHTEEAAGLLTAAAPLIRSRLDRGATLHDTAAMKAVLFEQLAELVVKNPGGSFPGDLSPLK